MGQSEGTITRDSPTKVRISINIPWEDIEKKYRENVRSIGQDIRIRGFRKGRAPFHILERLFGKEVLEDTVSRQIEEKIGEVINENRIRPLTFEFGVKENMKIEENVGASFSREIDVLPEIDDMPLDGIEIEEKKEISDRDVMDYLERVVLENSPIKKKADGLTVSDSDIVELSGVVEYDFKGESRKQTIDAKVIDLMALKGVNEKLSSLLMGKKLNDEVKGKVPFPVDVEGSSVVVDATVDLRIAAVMERQRMRVDDEAARDMGYPSLYDLKESIRKRLEENATAEWIYKNGSKILNELVERVDFPLPEPYLSAIDRIISEKKQGGKVDEKEIENQRREIEREFRVNVLMMVIRWKKGLKISHESVERKLNVVRTMVSGGELSQEERKNIVERMKNEYMADEAAKVVFQYLIDEVIKLKGQSVKNGERNSKEMGGTDGREGSNGKSRETGE